MFNKSTAKTENLTQSLGLQAGGDALGIQGTGNTVTDGGAIAGSLGLAGSAIEQAAALTLGLVGAAEKTNKAALSAVQDSAAKGYEFAMSAGRSDVSTINNALKWGAALAALLGIAYILKGR